MKIAYLHFASLLFDEKLIQFQEFADLLETKFVEDASKVNEMLQNIPNKPNWEESKPYLDQKYLYEQFFVEHLRTANAVAIYTFFEARLLSLVELLSDALAIEVKNRGRDGISDCKIFLKDVIGVDFIPMNTEWEAVQRINKVRNCIVHCHCDLNLARSRTDMVSLIERNDHLYIEKDRFLRLTNGYIEWASISLSELYRMLVAASHEAGLNMLAKRLEAKIDEGPP